MIESLPLWLDGRVVMQLTCKAVYAGSIPASASKFCPGGGIGRHKGFKILEGNFVPVQVRLWAPMLKNT